MEPDSRRAEDFERALRVVLADRSLRDAAARVEREIEAMPAASDLAVEIEALADPVADSS
jgi:UDP:flavonoid glycosyltransferase YjiC (YdhE family)